MELNEIHLNNYLKTMLNFNNISIEEIISIEENLGSIYLELNNGDIYCLNLSITGE